MSAARSSPATSGATPSPTVFGVTVFVVDDDEAVRDALAMLLRSVDLAVETFASADTFLAAYDPARPGCLLLDVRMPGMSGRELQERLNANGGSPPTVFITGHGDVPMAVGAMQAGAVDFLMKPFRDQELIDRVHRALAVDAERRREEAERRAVVGRLERLTPREREVLDMVVAGLTNKEMAERLSLSQRTVEIHRSKVMTKMAASSLAVLVRAVLEAEEGLSLRPRSQAG